MYVLFIHIWMHMYIYVYIYTHIHTHTTYIDIWGGGLPGVGLATQSLGSPDASPTLDTCYVKSCWHPTQVVRSL